MIMDCYICGYLIPGPTKTLLNQKTSLSCTPIINILDKIFAHLDLKFTEHGENNCCQECLSKINEYDISLTKLTRIESEFKTIYYSRIGKNQTIKDDDIDFFDVRSISDSINELDDLKDDIKNEDFFRTTKTNKDDIFYVATGTTMAANNEHSKKSKPKPKRKLKSLTYFQCDKCKQIFNTKLRITEHLRNHFTLSRSGKATYPCQYCGKIYKGKALLDQHLPVHTGERPIQCEICGKRFHTATFAKHKLIHMKDSHKKCTLCSKGFTTMSRLKRHMITHTKEKPFLCTICGKSFSERYILTAHIKSHPGANIVQTQKSYFCQLCHTGFDTPENLTEHLAFKHNIQAITQL